MVCTPGYWEKPEANAQLFTQDGWMHTGDVGLIDADGFLHITAVSYTHLRAHETVLDLVCRLLLEKKKKHNTHTHTHTYQDCKD